MSDLFAIAAKRIFDGETWHEDAALIVSAGTVKAIVSRGEFRPGQRSPKPETCSRPASSTCR